MLAQWLETYRTVHELGIEIRKSLGAIARATTYRRRHILEEVRDTQMHIDSLLNESDRRLDDELEKAVRRGDGHRGRR